MGIVNDLHEATAAHEKASEISDAADDEWSKQDDQLFVDPDVLERQEVANNERLRTWAVMHDLRWRLAWGIDDPRRAIPKEGV